MRTTVTLDGVTHEIVDIGLTGAVAFERHFGLPSSVLNPADPTPGRMEWTAFQIYKSLQKTGVFERSLTFDAALEILDDAEVAQTLEPGDENYEGEEVADVDPTPAPSAEPAAP